jgi:hypothetical protein
MKSLEYRRHLIYRAVLKKFFNMMCALCIISFVFCSCDYSLNIKEEKILFSKFTQDERKEYIADYLMTNYHESYDISEVKKRQIDAIRNEEDYYAIATDPNGNMIDIWVSNYGEITDDKFLLDVQNKIETKFTEIIKKEFTECDISCSAYLDSPPSRKWDNSSDIDDIFDVEDVYIYVRVFISDAYNRINENLLNEIKNQLNFCNGRLFIYECNNTSDMEEFDYSDYSFYVDFTKE